MKHDPATDPTSPETGRERGWDSITGLIRNLATDLSGLLGKEIALAKSEARQSVAEVQTALGALASGTAIATAGLVILLMSAVYGLSNVLAPWLSALIVGAAALLVGYVMVHSAKRQLNAKTVTPERTMASAKKDKETLKRATR